MFIHALPAFIYSHPWTHGCAGSERMWVVLNVIADPIPDQDGLNASTA